MAYSEIWRNASGTVKVLKDPKLHQLEINFGRPAKNHVDPQYVEDFIDFEIGFSTEDERRSLREALNK